MTNCSCNSHKNMIGYHLQLLSENLDIYSSTYDKFTILGDFNVVIRDLQSKSFCDSYSLKSLAKQPRCYERSTNLRSTDLILKLVSAIF